MAQRVKSASIDTRTARLKLPVSGKPIFTKIGPGISLGYRRNSTDGTWVLRLADGKGGNSTGAIGIADDFDEADGKTRLNYWQAQEAARAAAKDILAKANGEIAVVAPAKVADALDSYEADLKTRRGDIGNVGRVRLHLPVDFLERSVAELTTTELRNWRDTLRKKLAPATVNRTSAALKAVLNRAAIHDERIINRRAWDVGLLALPDAEQSRNVILTDDQARTVIAAACYLDKAFGLFVEVAAITGARPSQLAKLTVADLQNDSHAPFLLMPTSAKGRGQKAQLQRRNSITIPLAGRLHAATEGRCRTEKLLTKTNGTNWGKSDHTRPVRRAVTTAGLNPAEVTIYALRHSSIVRQLLAGVPTRVVAANHDTSVAMLERTYSRHIGDHADQIVRAGLLTAD
jgi:integrase